jgi:hypothetical protein
VQHAPRLSLFLFSDKLHLELNHHRSTALPTLPMNHQHFRPSEPLAALHILYRSRPQQYNDNASPNNVPTNFQREHNHLPSTTSSKKLERRAAAPSFLCASVSRLLYGGRARSGPHTSGRRRNALGALSSLPGVGRPPSSMARNLRGPMMMRASALHNRDPGTRSTHFPMARRPCGPRPPVRVAGGPSFRRASNVPSAPPPARWRSGAGCGNEAAKGEKNGVVESGTEGIHEALAPRAHHPCPCSCARLRLHGEVDRRCLLVPTTVARRRHGYHLFPAEAR